MFPTGLEARASCRRSMFDPGPFRSIAAEQMAVYNEAAKQYAADQRRRMAELFKPLDDALRRQTLTMLAMPGGQAEMARAHAEANRERILASNREAIDRAAGEFRRQVREDLDRAVGQYLDRVRPLFQTNPDPSTEINAR